MAAVVATAAFTFTACDNGGSKEGQGEASVKLSTPEDSITYNLGIFQAEEIKQALSYGQLDSAYIKDFIKGMKESASKENKKKDAYTAGYSYGKRLAELQNKLSEIVYAGDSTKKVDIKLIIAGYSDAINGKTKKTAEQAYSEFSKQLEPYNSRMAEKQYGENKKAGEKYLADNKKKEGVKTLKSGIQYKVLTEGKGALPTDTTVLKVNYEGKLIDGTVFDSSYQHNQPLEVDMANPGVIPGWVEVLKIMPAGSKWEVTIPADQAYGAQNAGPIQPFSTLIFTIEVLE